MANPKSSASRVRSNPVFRTVAKSGFAMSGVLHILIGLTAVSLAFGNHGRADQSGALGELANNPIGQALLWVITIGLWALGLFYLVTAVVLNGEAKTRISDAGKGVVYLAVGFSAVTFALGGSSSSSQQSQSLSAKVLAAPAGVVVLVIGGLVVVGVGIFFIQRGLRQKFRDDIVVPGGTAGTVAVTTGTIGYAAKGVAIGVVGVLFVVAAVTADPQKATGLDGALKSLAALPFGVFVLVVVALGLVIYGVYLFMRARYAKL